MLSYQIDTNSQAICQTKSFAFLIRMLCSSYQIRGSIPGSEKLYWETVSRVLASRERQRNFPDGIYRTRAHIRNLRVKINTVISSHTNTVEWANQQHWMEILIKRSKSNTSVRSFFRNVEKIALLSASRHRLDSTYRTTKAYVTPAYFSCQRALIRKYRK